MEFNKIKLIDDNQTLGYNIPNNQTIFISLDFEKSFEQS